MNQDNQVWWKKEFTELYERAWNLKEWIILHGTRLPLPVFIDFISRVAQDSYAEGIRRARVRAYETLASMLELEPGTKIHNAILQSLEQLEEEVKK